MDELIVYIVLGVIAVIIVTLLGHFLLGLTWLVAFISAVVLVVLGIWGIENLN
jgi:hypothetical protein